MYFHNRSKSDQLHVLVYSALLLVLPRFSPSSDNGRCGPSAHCDDKVQEALPGGVTGGYSDLVHR